MKKLKNKKSFILRIKMHSFFHITSIRIISLGKKFGSPILITEREEQNSKWYQKCKVAPS